jgi:hypothetical protein
VQLHILAASAYFGPVALPGSCNYTLALYWDRRIESDANGTAFVFASLLWVVGSNGLFDVDRRSYGGVVEVYLSPVKQLDLLTASIKRNDMNAPGPAVG